VSRAGVLSLAGVLAAAFTWAAAAQAPPPTDDVRAGSTVEFHGWSPDSRFVAYTRSKRRKSHRKATKLSLKRRSLHRRVKDGRFKGTGPVPPDVHIPRFAERRGYIVPDLDRLEVGDAETWFVAIEGTYKLHLSVGETLTWELSFDDEVIERRAFDSIYVTCQARLYPSPDRRHAVLVMHLDNGWNVDAAVYPLALPTRVNEAWTRLHGVPHE